MDSQDFISAPKPNSKKLMHSRGTTDEQSGNIKASFFSLMSTAVIPFVLSPPYSLDLFFVCSVSNESNEITASSRLRDSCFVQTSNKFNWTGL